MAFRTLIAICALWLCLTSEHAQKETIVSSALQHTTLQPSILDPASIPPWFRTGTFRSARWDGGPIEAEKGRLSGWPGFKLNDSLNTLQATEDWYNPRTIELLKIAHINWAWLTWSTGFSPKTEMRQRQIVSQYIRLCHQSNIHVAAYISIGNMFWADMFQNLPASISWVKRDFRGGPVLYMGEPSRYMADIRNSQWIELQKERVEAAVHAGADALWIDNTFSFYNDRDVAHLIEVLYDAATKQNPHFVIMSNLNKDIYTWARMQNAVTTEDGEEPGYYSDQTHSHLITNAGLLRYNYGIGEGWRPVSVEYEGRHEGARLLNPMTPRKWQLAIAEAAMYHTSLEIAPEGRFLRDLYFGDTAAMTGLRAIGSYNLFLEENEQYYINPHTLSRVAVLADATDNVVPYLNQLSESNLNYDVLFNYETPESEDIRRYRVIVLPGTNPLSPAWCKALTKWVDQDGGTLIAIQGASLFSTARSSPVSDFGLGKLLEISKDKIPSGEASHPRGRGTAVYFPEAPATEEMVSVVQQYLKQSELVEIERRGAVLSNVAIQPKRGRIIVHLLNYQQNVEKNLRIIVRAPVTGVTIVSPDALDDQTAKVAEHGKSWEVVVPEIRTYDLVAISLGSDTKALSEEY